MNCFPIEDRYSDSISILHYIEIQMQNNIRQIGIKCFSFLHCFCVICNDQKKESYMGLLTLAALTFIRFSGLSPFYDIVLL